MSENKNVVLVSGKPSTGKSASLMNLKNKDRWVYLNADLKELPFVVKPPFAANVEISDPLTILEFIQEIETNSDIDGVVLDTITYLMSMFETQVVVGAVNGQAAWGAYGNFYKQLIHAIKSGSKNYAVLAHELSEINQSSGKMETSVPVKGAVGKVGVEADFTTIVSAKTMLTSSLEGFENDLLHITDEEKEDGLKRVFVTRTVKDTLGDKTRSAIGLWSRKELYIDNDLDQVFTRLNKFYN